MSELGTRIAEVGAAAQAKETTRQQARAEAARQREVARQEAAKQRQEKWTKLVAGVKDKVQQFKDWDKQAGADIRKVVDMTPGVVGAVALTVQEKAVEARNVAFDTATAVTEAGRAAGQAVGEAVVGAAVSVSEGAARMGRGMVRGAEIGVGVVVLAGLEAANFVVDRIDDARDLGESISVLVSETGRDIKRKAEVMKQSAELAFRGAVDTVKAKFGEKRQQITSAYESTKAEVTGRVARGKQRVVQFHEDDKDRLHDAIAGLHGLEHRVVAGVAGFATRVAEMAASLDDTVLEKRQQQLNLKSIRVDVEEAMERASR